MYVFFIVESILQGVMLFLACLSSLSEAMCLNYVFPSFQVWLNIYKHYFKQNT